MKHKQHDFYLVADTHFNHAKLEEWGGRSGDWQRRILYGISRIPAGNTLIHLGDICIGNDREVHEDLLKYASHVHRILVRGNHDKASTTWYMDHGWDFVCDGIDLVHNGFYVRLTHRPQNRAYAGINNFNIHGHTHGNMHRSEEHCDWYDPAYNIDVSPEVVGFAPVSLGAILRENKK